MCWFFNAMCAFDEYTASPRLESNVYCENIRTSQRRSVRWIVGYPVSLARHPGVARGGSQIESVRAEERGERSERDGLAKPDWRARQNRSSERPRVSP